MTQRDPGNPELLCSVSPSSQTTSGSEEGHRESDCVQARRGRMRAEEVGSEAGRETGTMLKLRPSGGFAPFSAHGMLKARAFESNCLE